MILNASGQPLKRAIGFVTAFVPVRKSAPPADVLDVVGLDSPAVVEEKEEV